MVRFSTRPNLLVIGAMKSGTTSLHSYLNVHPEIYMSEKKEIDFFSKKYNNTNLDYYLEFFNAEYKIRGESSQNYSKYHLFKDVPQRIFETLGSDIKFIYVLRDPIKRIISHYYEAQSQNRIEVSLDKYLEGNLENNNIILTSLYYKQLSKFLEFYPIEKFKIITFERLKENRVETMNEIYNFLKLKSIKDYKVYDYILNPSDNKRSKNILYKLFYNSFIFKKIKSILSVEFKKYLTDSKFFKYFFTKKIIYDYNISSHKKKIIYKLIQNDVNKLKKLTSKDFNEWNLKF